MGEMSAGDEAKFADLYEEHRSNLWLYCRRRVGADTADDAMGDVFLTVWRRIDDAPPAGEALPWLYRIAHLTISNHWRTFGRRRRLKEKAEAMGVSPPVPIADQIIVRDEVRRVVALLDRLPAPDTEILRLAAWEHLNTTQIASVLDISPDAAKQRLSRARKRLAALYEQEKPDGASTQILGKEVRGEH